MQTKNELQQRAIINILSDHILWVRVEECLFKISNAFNPSKKECMDWTAEDNFHGYTTALMLLGIENNEDLCSELCDVTSKMISESENASTELAKDIYFEWLVAIKNFFTLKSVA